MRLLQHLAFGTVLRNDARGQIHPPTVFPAYRQAGRGKPSPLTVFPAYRQAGRGKSEKKKYKQRLLTCKDLNPETVAKNHEWGLREKATDSGFFLTSFESSGIHHKTKNHVK